MAARNPFEYTLNMETIFQGKLSELKSYYCREDFELALADYDRAPEDAKKFRMRDVSRLCDARGIKVRDLLEDREAVLAEIPYRPAMQEELLESFYEMYTQSHAASDFMERIVRRLAPEYSSDTVRTAILKKFVAGGGKNFKKFNTKKMLEWAEKQLNREESEVYQDASEEEKSALLLAKIDDSIFEHPSVELTDTDILNLMIDRIAKYQENDALPFEKIEVSEDTMHRLSELLSEEKRTDSDDVQDLLRLLSYRVETGNVKPEEAEFSRFVAGLEKDFRNQLKTIKRVSKTGKPGTAADLYKQAKKDALKAKKAAASKNDMDFGLIEMCNDLAAGNFRVNGKTKVYLYYFAFMFGMTLPLDGKRCEPERDIVKNLLQDFYNDNFLRVLSADQADSKNATSIEKEPTGEGINYKSFVEMIYIYFLCRDDLDMTPGEKIDRAEALIEECGERARKEGQAAPKNAGVHTEIYRDRHLNVLLNKDMDEIADYILAHYQVYSPDDNGIARIMIASEENTAFDLIEEIMDDLDGAYLDIDLFGVRQKSDLTDKIKEDIAFQLDLNFDWAVKRALEEKYSDDTDFLKVLRAIDERTHIENGRFNKKERDRMLMLLHVLAVHSSEKNTLSMYRLQSRLEEKGVISVGNQISNAISTLSAIGFKICRVKDSYYLGEREYGDDLLNSIFRKVSGRYYSVDSTSELLMTEALICRLRFNKRVTRCELISIHFSYYIALMNETVGLDTFPDVFEDYAATINPYLEEARYQPLSEKNIFDMYIVTALYFYLVENNRYM